MGVHDNHRDRVKSKFRKSGLDDLHDHEVLELLLFYAIPRVDVNPIAHALMGRFGTLHAVFEASVEELCRVEGIGENSATLIRLTMDIMRRYGIDRKEHMLLHKRLDSTEAFGDYVTPHFFGLRYELVLMVCVDHKGVVISCEELSRGSVDETGISVRKVVEAALACRAHGVVLAHNHPQGLALASDADVAVTREIRDALALVGIPLLDHIIVADPADPEDGLQDDYISMHENQII